MLIKRKIYSLVIFLIIVGVVSLLLLRSSKDYSILPSALPQNELWTIEYAEAMQKKAFNIGIPQVLDEKTLLELVRHAYQWDKNAMIQYAKIVENENEIAPDYSESLGAFLKKYSHELVDKNGKPLTDPIVLQLPYHDFMKKLADLKYPVPSSYMASRMLYSAGQTDGYFNPLTDENHQKLISYTKNAINGGYKSYGALGNYILFKTGFGFKDPNATQLNKLTDHILNLPNSELVEAINTYQTCANNGSQYCMLRVTEAYFYGIGVDKNLEQAYAWSQVTNQAYEKYLKKISDSAGVTVDETENIINNYNLELASQLKETFTSSQLEENPKLIEQLRSKINWDYNTWVSKKAPVPPMP